MRGRPRSLTAAFARTLPGELRVRGRARTPSPPASAMPTMSDMASGYCLLLGRRVGDRHAQLEADPFDRGADVLVRRHEHDVHVPAQLFAAEREATQAGR